MSASASSTVDCVGCDRRGGGAANRSICASLRALLRLQRLERGARLAHQAAGMPASRATCTP